MWVSGTKCLYFPRASADARASLHSSLPMLWWLLPEEWIVFCWHWKDAQKIKIIKSVTTVSAGMKCFCSATPDLVAAARGVSHGELCANVTFCWRLCDIWDRGGVGAAYAVSPRKPSGAEKLRDFLRRTPTQSRRASDIFSSLSHEVSPPGENP